MRILLILLLLVVAGLIYYRRRSAAAETPASDRVRRIPQASDRYHAVAIRFTANACAAAKGMAGVRYLANEAPPLPLPGCDASRCECRYAHYDDRRSGKDRRSPFAAGGLAGGTGRFDVERRDGEDRRRSDRDGPV